MPTPSREPLSGVYAALVTPMTADGSEIALPIVGPLLTHLSAARADGFLVLGTTGESASLSFAEKLALVAEASSCAGGLRMIVGCGSCSLNETLELVELAARRNAQAVLVPPPFYFRNAVPGGIERFFEAVLERARLPVILYHIPLLTGLPLDRKMLGRLKRFDTLWGVKDSGGRLQDTSRFLASPPRRVMLGSDMNMLDGLKIGVSGIISACANVAPELHRAIYDAYRSGRDAERLQERLVEIRKSLKDLPFIAALKRWLAYRGVDAGGARLPQLNLTPGEEDRLRQSALRYAPPD